MPIDETKNSAQTSVVIPARLESSRLPGKVLLDLGGKPVLQHVWERALGVQSAAEVIIATDSPEVRERAEAWGARVLMTARECPNGTARIATIVEQLAGDFVINLQGDEPFVEPGLLDALAAAWQNGGGDVITAVRPVDDAAELANPNVVKAVLGAESRALYFSRSPVPFLRDVDPTKWAENHVFWAHIGLYGYTRETLVRYRSMAPATLENAERLEQLRFLENGLLVRAIQTKYRPLGIDTAEDLERARERIQRA